MRAHAVGILLILAISFRYAVQRDSKDDSSNETGKTTPKKVAIDHLLFTRNNPEDAYNLQPTATSVQNSPFDSSLRSIMFIHGYMEVLNHNFSLFKVKDAILEEGDYNVIVVNWSDYNQGSYPKVAKHAKRVGVELSRMVQFLIDQTGVKAESFYLVGHSMGGVVASYIGKAIKNIGRITGLDAAGPYYEGKPRESRLSYSDALFVDAIHTSGATTPQGGSGFKKAFAHQDFFPNGGHQQPGCNKNERYLHGNETEGRVTSNQQRVFCNHCKAIYIYLDSVNNCRFLSVKCDSYRDYRQGKCPAQSSLVTPMGFHARPIKNLPIKTKFYLQTHKKSPYCMSPK